MNLETGKGGDGLNAKRGVSFWFLLMLGLFLAGCGRDAIQEKSPTNPVQNQVNAATATLTPFQPVPFTLTPILSATPLPSMTATESPLPKAQAVWAGPEVPAELVSQTVLPGGWIWTDQPGTAGLRLEGGPTGIPWYFVLAAPFATVADEISLDRLEQAWRGSRLNEANNQPLLVDGAVLHSLTQAWGEPEAGAVLVAGDNEIKAKAWELRGWAVIGFDQLDPSWKVIRVNGKTPLSRGVLENYPLVFSYHLVGSAEALAQFQQDGGKLAGTNRDPAKMTTLLMTGTTALVRAVGYKMETKGMEYPGEAIRAWLQDADFTHISSESSFNKACPPANPVSKSFMFCSRPEYIQLFDSVGVNIIELSGNHNNDWGRDAFLYSLDLFKQRGWKWFAGGENATAARQPLLIEHNGNRIALIGCNYAGPPGVWATSDEPGAAHCNLDWMDQELARLRGEGYLPVVTFQYNEIYQMKPSEGQMRDFRRESDAGAVIVSGSQAHFPQTYELRNGSLIHYGLGNLFFDQMDTPVDGTRRELLDLHVFYSGKYISTVVLTALLEDYARPRPMTDAERSAFLQELFTASGW